VNLNTFMVEAKCGTYAVGMPPGAGPVTDDLRTPA
jgi:hypothetical protein